MQVQQCFDDVTQNLDYLNLWHTILIILGRQFLNILEQIFAGRFLKNVGTLAVLYRSNLLYNICVNWDSFAKIDVLACAGSSLHD